MIARVIARLAARLPVLPGAVEAVKTAASAYPVALASGSAAADHRGSDALTGLDQVFGAMIDGDDMTHGKPDPEIYLTTAAQARRRSGAVSGHRGFGQRAARAQSGGDVRHRRTQSAFPPSDDLLAQADALISSLTEFSLDLVREIEAKA